MRHRPNLRHLCLDRIVVLHVTLTVLGVTLTELCTATVMGNHEEMAVSGVIIAPERVAAQLISIWSAPRFTMLPAFRSANQRTWLTGR